MRTRLVATPSVFSSLSTCCTTPITCTAARPRPVSRRHLWFHSMAPRPSSFQPLCSHTTLLAFHHRAPSLFNAVQLIIAPPHGHLVLSSVRLKSRQEFSVHSLCLGLSFIGRSPLCYYAFVRIPPLYITSSQSNITKRFLKLRIITSDRSPSKSAHSERSFVPQTR